MNPKAKLRFGVIGQGHIGKRYAEIIRQNPDCQLIAICDTKSKEELGLSNIDELYFTSVDELLQKVGTSIDVISICVPNGLHYQVAIKALNEEKHVVIEKPMTLTSLDAENIIKKSQEVSKQVFCVMQNRYSPTSKWLKEIIEQKRLGKLYIVQVNCYWNRDDRYYKPSSWHGTANMDGGVLFTQFSHFIDTLFWLFGDIENIRADFRDFCHQKTTDFEDSGFVSFDFINGGKGLFNYSTAIWNQNLESSITIIGEKGTIKIQGQYMNEVAYCDVHDYTMPELAPSNHANKNGLNNVSAKNHQDVIQNVVDTLLYNKTITTNALEGLKVVDIIERIYSLRNLNEMKN